MLLLGRGSWRLIGRSTCWDEPIRVRCCVWTHSVIYWYPWEVFWLWTTSSSFPLVDSNKKPNQLVLHIEICYFWIFFSPVFLGWWEDISGSEKSENFWPHMGFWPKLFFKNSCFLVITLIIGVSWSVHWPQGVYMRLITKNWWILEKKFGWKPHMGSKFFKIFTSKTFPPSS